MADPTPGSSSGHRNAGVETPHAPRPAGEKAHTGTRPSFDVCGPLPTRTTVLEASAGTGKTYTIAALAARYIAEGHVELSELMMVTFSRMATNELRSRVRERLVDCDRVLAARLAGTTPSEDRPADSVLALLCDGSDAVLAARHHRIRAALVDFDAATIATTHQFCQEMLNGLGVLGDREPDATFTESLSDLADEIATDCYVQRFAPLTQPPPFTFDDASAVAREVISASTARLVPEMPDGDDAGVAGADPAASGAAAVSVANPAAAHRYGFAVDVRNQLKERKQRRRLYSFDDMLTRLQSTLSDPTHGEIAAERLRERFRVVLVDEFQDTDPVQWDILRRAFAGHSTLILIGDPKQAIYAFRGADVYCYLDAVAQASTVETLDTNWRSDAAVVDALHALFGHVALGDARIGVRPVRARYQHRRLLPAQDRLVTQPPSGDGSSNERSPAAGAESAGAEAVDSPGLEPLRVRIEPYDPESGEVPRVGDVRRRISQDLVADVADLLSRRPQLDLDGLRRTIEPSDIAVLVRRNKRAEELRDALAAADIPAVVLGANSVYAGEMARDWLTLLTALEQPRQGTIRAAALTPFIGWTMHGLACAGEQALARLAATIRRWSRLLADRGVATLMEAISSERRLTSQLLSSTGGERRLTDLRHIGQSLHAAMSSGQLGIASLIDWLRQRIDEAQNITMDDRSRRLESDAEAVQILTVHRSKGLEFPIVYLPEAWDRYVPDDNGGWLRLHDDESGAAAHPAGTGGGAEPGTSSLVLDVGGLTGPGRADRLVQSRREEAGEDLRQAYVAFTRAQLQVVTWWAPSFNTSASPLHRFLFRPRSSHQSDPIEPAERYEMNSDPFALPGLGAAISLERMEGRKITTWRTDQTVPDVLTHRHFDRSLDLDWRRTSYTALTAAAHAADRPATAVTSEPEPTKEDDESSAGDLLTEFDSLTEFDGVPAAENGIAEQNPVSPMDELPTGADFGTVVHAVLERMDPRADALEPALRDVAAEELSRLPAQSMSADELAAGLIPAVHTPLGPLAGDHRLVDLDTSDRLTELNFELPLAGGDRPNADVRLGEVADLLADHLARTDPLAPYPGMLAGTSPDAAFVDKLSTHPATGTAQRPSAGSGLRDQPLRGFLTGSIDAVLRIRTASGETRYLVADYKSNWIGPVDERPLRVSAYHPDRLPEVMMQAHYPLQALLYSVALHRFLRWRQPGYRPDDHLGGILYLFLRGMAGPATPRLNGVPCGVFSWRPPATLITELSDLLDHGRSPLQASTADAGGV